jgi:hypothetical protein
MQRSSTTPSPERTLAWHSRWPLSAIFATRKCAACVTLATFLISVSAPAKAEIILDEFDEAFEIHLPEMQNRPYIVQANVGPLRAERWSDVKAFSARPSGQFDAHISRASALTFEFDQLNRTDTLLPIVTANLLYKFNEIDVTEGGVNDHFIVDFAYMRSAMPMSSVSVFIQDASQPGISYGAETLEIPPHDGPFSLEFRLDSFGVRGGGTGEANYRRVNNVAFLITPAFLNSIDGINFSTAIERIRFTREIPEPATFALANLGILWTGLLMLRRRMSL